VGPGADQDRCGKSRPTVLEPRNFQPVASRYTDHAIPAPFIHCTFTLLLTDASDPNVLYGKPDDTYP
jgi:hypothetical protein